MASIHITLLSASDVEETVDFRARYTEFPVPLFAMLFEDVEIPWRPDRGRTVTSARTTRPHDLGAI